MIPNFEQPRLYCSSGTSVFFSVNSSESTMFGWSERQCIMQLPPVWSNDTVEPPPKKPEASASLRITDMGKGGNSLDSRFALSLRIFNVQTPLRGSFAGRTV